MGSASLEWRQTGPAMHEAIWRNLRAAVDGSGPVIRWQLFDGAREVKPQHPLDRTAPTVTLAKVEAEEALFLLARRQREQGIAPPAEQRFTAAVSLVRNAEPVALRLVEEALAEVPHTRVDQPTARAVPLVALASPAPRNQKAPAAKETPAKKQTPPGMAKAHKGYRRARLRMAATEASTR